jgi:hypothetical protein
MNICISDGTRNHEGEKIKGANVPQLQRRTTPTVTVSWHYLTRSTSLKYILSKKRKEI